MHQGYSVSPVDKDRTPIENLSPAKRRALIACLEGNGVLHKRGGIWMPALEGPATSPICGTTVADLGRDGMLQIDKVAKQASAQITALGIRYARALADTLGLQIDGESQAGNSHAQSGHLPL